MENIIFKTVVGSQAYGTATPTSDIDIKGVYVQEDDMLLSYQYKEQKDVSKDETYYEIKRFIELAASANPTMLEMLFIPTTEALLSSPAWDFMHSQRHIFLTKKCGKAFGGYAVGQIQKAKGLDKKMNWEKARTERKTVLDFCFVHVEGRSVPVEQWLRTNKFKQEFCGLVALDRMSDLYSLYYDYVGQYLVEYPDATKRQVAPMGYHGLVGEDSNDVRLSSVPKGQIPVTVLSFNKDAYSTHCKNYREYQDWLKTRNQARYVDVAGHGQQIDGKNLLHCRRLIDCGLEIATEGNWTVRRNNAEYLLKIRRGEVPLQEIINQAEEDLIKMDEAFTKSSLPEELDWKYLNDLILYVRRLNRQR